MVSQVEQQWQSESHETERYSKHDETWNSWGVSAVTDPSKCAKCGSKKHRTADCSTDLSNKLRCFRCNGGTLVPIVQEKALVARLVIHRKETVEVPKCDAGFPHEK